MQTETENIFEVFEFCKWFKFFIRIAQANKIKNKGLPSQQSILVIQVQQKNAYFFVSRGKQESKKAQTVVRAMTTNYRVLGIITHERAPNRL